MSRLKGIMIFLAGAAVGAAVSYRLTKKKYLTLADEEVESVKRAFSKHTPAPAGDAGKGTANEPVRYSKRREADADMRGTKKKRVISPDEFGESDDYERSSYTYYSDGVLADENDDVVEDPADILGTDALGSFGEYEDDAVYVRDDTLNREYEVLLDSRRYKDIPRPGSENGV